MYMYTLYTITKAQTKTKARDSYQILRFAGKLVLLIWASDAPIIGMADKYSYFSASVICKFISIAHVQYQFHTRVQLIFTC